MGGLKNISDWIIAATLTVVLWALAAGCGGSSKLVSATIEKGTFIDPRDGQSYRTVKIGETRWMAENLNYSTPKATNSICRETQLYNWNTAMNVCPPGWRLPNNAEWDDLVAAAGGREVAGKKLKARTGWPKGWFWNGSGTDDFGFSALACGGAFSSLARADYRSGHCNYFISRRDNDNKNISENRRFSYLWTGRGFWWSATGSNGSAWRWSMYPRSGTRRTYFQYAFETTYKNSVGALKAGSRWELYSVRCVEEKQTDDEADERDFGFQTAENGQSIVIINYVGGKKNVRIPSQIQGLPVSRIGNNAFRMTMIDNITIPSSVTTIGELAFAGNQLRSVIIPSSVTAIGGAAFSENPLTDFSVVTDNTTYTVSDFFLMSKDGKRLVAYYGNEKNVVIPNGVTTIGRKAFFRKQLENVTIPDGVTTIENWAFAENELTDVIIPDGVTEIGRSAFQFNRLTDVTIPNSVAGIGVAAFKFNQLIDVTIPSSVTVIDSSAFRCNQLISVTIPSGVRIKGSAFLDNQLTSITIGADVYLELGSFDRSFRGAYNSTDKSAGTYILRNVFRSLDRWLKE